MVLAFLILSVSEKASGVIHSTAYSLNRVRTSHSDELNTVRDEPDELEEDGHRGPSEMNEDHKAQCDLFKRVHQHVVEDMKSALHHSSTAGAEASLHPIEKKGADENISLGGQILRQIIHSISCHVVFVTPSELLAKAGLVHAIVKLYLPAGKLLFVNQNVVKQYEQLLQRVAA
ncbi:hypothetical protein HPB47_026084 [Ixodes persulcatus]|uniref:Uncharacterized protein n=1 Tax=Ixodes persulcatus TaxID=34615 RepID=A0AC60PZP6_IXOPE|nr:hypothetical protein HPB47_026084 [Ixodes persulcatus]